MITISVTDVEIQYVDSVSLKLKTLQNTLTYS